MKGLRTILKGLSLTTALFVFQACYGTPYGYDTYGAAFKVVSASDGTPLDGVEIKARPAGYGADWVYCASTDETGYAEGIVRLSDVDNPEFLFTLNGSEYAVKDTVVTNFRGRVTVVKLDKVQ